MNSHLNRDRDEPYLAQVEARRMPLAADIVIYWRQQGDNAFNSGAGGIGRGAEDAYIQVAYFGANPNTACPRPAGGH